MSLDISMFEKTVVYVEQNYIPVSLTCDFFGITYRGQIEKIKTDLILQNEWKKISYEKVFGDRRGRVCLTKKGFLRWIQLLNPQLVSDNLKEKLTLYQSTIFDWMYGISENKEKATVSYQRLNKLKKLYKKISAEIDKEKSIIARYVSSHFAPELPFES